jgi:hypothetical protein
MAVEETWFSSNFAIFHFHFREDGFQIPVKLPLETIFSRGNGAFLEATKTRLLRGWRYGQSLNGDCLLDSRIST